MGSALFGELFNSEFAIATLFSGLAVVWLSIGVIWTPFGIWICSRIARTLGLPTARFAAAGAAYSLAMFLPWIYLVLRMKGARVPRSIIVTAYAILYTTWVGFESSFSSLAMGIGGLGGLESWLYFIPFILLLIISVCALLDFLPWQLGEMSAFGCDSDDGILPPVRYIIPFALLSLNHLIWFIMLYLSF